MIIAYALVLLLLTCYSYSLIDLNLTLINHPLWEIFRKNIIQIGYFRRDLSWMIYVLFIAFLFVFHYFLVKKYKKLHSLNTALIIGGILFFSYPFLSHDFFNYLFDAKILTYYHQNPYLHKALDFPKDPWLLFMQWTHRNYPYGPTFLAISSIPSFLSFGKLLLNIFLFKGIVISLYVLSVAALGKLNKKAAIIFATHPLILVEGLINLHNDFVALCLAVLAVYLLLDQKKLWARVFFLLSAGIKYTTVPTLFISAKNKKLNTTIFIALAAIIVYINVTLVPQPWYFLNLFIFLPFFERFLSRLNLLFAGLLLSYYPFIRFGNWDQIGDKYTIIVVSVVLNALLLATIYAKGKKDSS